MNTEYRKDLQRKIQELELQIANQQGTKLELEQQLNKLKIAEFQEAMIEENNQILLKG